MQNVEFNDSVVAVHEATRKIAQSIEAIRDRIAEADERVRDLETARPSLEELREMARRLVMNASIQWRARNAAQLLAAIAPAVQRDRHGALRRGHGPKLPDFLLLPLGGNTLVGLAPDLVLAAIDDMLEITETDGRPIVSLETRHAEISAAEAAIAELEAMEERMIREARAGGLAVPRRGPVQERLTARLETLREDHKKRMRDVESAQADANHPMFNREARAEARGRAVELRTALLPLEREIEELVRWM